MVLGGTHKAWFTFKDCINYVKPQGMCFFFFKSVNKYRSEGERRWGFHTKIKCLSRLETCSHQLHFKQQFWFLHHLLNVSLSPLWSWNTCFFISCSKAIFQHKKKTSHQIPNKSHPSIFWHFPCQYPCFILLSVVWRETGGPLLFDCLELDL